MTHIPYSAFQTETNENPLPGERNDTLFRHACRLRARGAETYEIRDDLEGLNARLSEPLPAAEIESITNSVVMRYLPGTARDDCRDGARIRPRSEAGSQRRAAVALVPRLAPDPRDLVYVLDEDGQVRGYPRVDYAPGSPEALESAYHYSITPCAEAEDWQGPGNDADRRAVAETLAYLDRRGIPDAWRDGARVLRGRTCGPAASILDGWAERGRLLVTPTYSLSDGSFCRVQGRQITRAEVSGGEPPKKTLLPYGSRGPDAMASDLGRRILAGWLPRDCGPLDVVLCEGDIDYYTMQAAVPACATAVLAAPGAGSLPRIASALAGRRLLPRGSTVWVCADRDEAGERVLPEMATTLAAAGYRVVRLPLPAGANDANEALERLGPDGWRVWVRSCLRGTATCEVLGEPEPEPEREEDAREARREDTRALTQRYRAELRERGRLRRQHSGATVIYTHRDGRAALACWRPSRSWWDPCGGPYRRALLETQLLERLEEETRRGGELYYARVPRLEEDAMWSRVHRQITRAGGRAIACRTERDGSQYLEVLASARPPVGEWVSVSPEDVEDLVHEMLLELGGVRGREHAVMGSRTWAHEDWPTREPAATDDYEYLGVTMMAPPRVQSELSAGGIAATWVGAGDAPASKSDYVSSGTLSFFCQGEERHTLTAVPADPDHWTSGVLEIALARPADLERLRWLLGLLRMPDRGRRAAA